MLLNVNKADVSFMLSSAYPMSIKLIYLIDQYIVYSDDSNIKPCILYIEACNGYYVYGNARDVWHKFVCEQCTKLCSINLGEKKLKFDGGKWLNCCCVFIGSKMFALVWNII